MFVVYNFTLISSHMLKCIWAHTRVAADIVYIVNDDADIIWSTVSSCFWHSLHFLPVFDYNLCVPYFLAWNIRFCTGITSLSVSAFRFPLDSHRHMSLSIISYLFIINTLMIHYFAIPFSSKPLLTCVFMFRAFHFASLLTLLWFISCPTSLFICWIRILLMAFVAFNNIYKLIFFIFCFQIFCKLFISALYVASIWNKLLLLSSFFFYIAYLFQLSGDAYCTLVVSL